MKKIEGVSNHILEINLTNRSFNIYVITRKERKMYLGGKGLGLKLLSNRIVPGIDPLDKKNIIAFMPGVMMGTGAPCSARFVAITKSPQTGIMASSSCGGPFGMELKTAGWDGLLVSGKSESPVILKISTQGIEFIDAEGIWGKDTIAAQDMIISKIKSEKKGAALVIGQAGENLVKYANIMSGHRFLGRAGMGAVMGSKGLKGIIAIGKEYKIIAKNVKKLKKLNNQAVTMLKESPVNSHGLKKYGSLSLVNISNSAGILPVKNYTDGTSDNAYKLSGEYISEKFKTKSSSCKACAVVCGKKGEINGKQVNVPEYESISLLGANLDIWDPEIITEWNTLCNRYGMDTISAGSTIGWVMEAAEKGLVTSKLKFGNPKGIRKTLKDIAYCKGFGKEMAQGTRSLSEKYGGENFAIHVKGLELPAYDPRGSYGLGLGYAVSNRGGCHLSSVSMANEVFLGILEPYKAEGKAEWVDFMENLMCCVNSIQTCLYTLYAYMSNSWLPRYNSQFIVKLTMQYLPKLSIKIADIGKYHKFWSAVTGIKISRSQFIKAGKRIHVLERYMNTQEGISRKDDILPARFMTEGRSCDPKNRTVPLDEMIDKYYRIKGYDQDGIPAKKTLKKLGIT